MTTLQILWIIVGVLLGISNFPFGYLDEATKEVRIIFGFAYGVLFYTLTVYPVRYFFDR